MKDGLTNFIFPSDTRRTTSTPKPIKTTTTAENWYWREWSNPSDTKDNHIDSLFSGGSSNGVKNWSENPSQTTTETPSWLREIANEYTTTNKENLLPWMQNVSEEYSTPPNHPNKNRNQQFIQTTTLKTIKTTTINSFWREWSATKPTDINDNQIGSGFSQKLPKWVEETTTVKTNTAPWILNTLNEYNNNNNNDRNDRAIFATTQKVQTVTELPSWMQEVLTEYSLATTRKTLTSFQSENGTKKSTNVGGDGGSILSIGGGNGDLHLSSQNRYSICIARNTFFIRH